MSGDIYSDLADWYYLLDPTEDHEEDASIIYDGIVARCDGPLKSLLELGSGGGNTAYFLSQKVACTLTDISPQMIELSRNLNPQCHHEIGDMTTMRLPAVYDAVLAHDSLVYMNTREMLQQAIETAFVHLRPGGVAVFAPDYYKDSFQEKSELHQGSDKHRALRCLDWTWDPDPTDEQYSVSYSMLIRDGSTIKNYYEESVEGLFSRETWATMLHNQGFDVKELPRPVYATYAPTFFVCQRQA